ncbi:MAG: transposase, partial [Caldilineaceae bacterium]|nr:transposase [Caldilineaceae bacterium]
MASTPKSTTQESPTVIRTLRVRLYPGTAANGQYLEQLAGACRFAWNHVLAGHETDYRMWKAFGKLGEGPGSPTFFTLGQRFTQLRNAPGHEWLQDYSYEIVRYACKYMGDAYAAFFDPDRPDHGRPQYKARHYTKPAFTIPSKVRIQDGRLYIPKMGWTRLGPVHRYADGKPLTVRVKQESESKQPKWYAYIVFEVPSVHPDVCQPAAEGAVGIDRNVGQATDSTGAVHAIPDTTVEDAKIKRYQRRMARQKKGSHRRRRTGGKLRKLQRRKARRRDNATHQVSRKMADTAHTVVIEDLNTKAMTKSAKGTVENPGRNVKQKAGLNRAILASGWGQLERK